MGDIAYFYSLDKGDFAVTKGQEGTRGRPAAEQAGRAADGRVFSRTASFILSADSIHNIQHYFNGKAVVSVGRRMRVPDTNQPSERMTLLKMWLKQLILCALYIFFGMKKNVFAPGLI